MSRHPTWPYGFEPCELCSRSDPPLTLRDWTQVIAGGVLGLLGVMAFLWALWLVGTP